MVRLESPNRLHSLCEPVLFQFLNGTIGVQLLELASIVVSFQFLNGTIGVHLFLSHRVNPLLFQFLNGTIGVYAIPIFSIRLCVISIPKWYDWSRYFSCFACSWIKISIPKWYDWSISYEPGTAQN